MKTFVRTLASQFWNSDHFPEISWSFLHAIEIEKLSYHKFCAHWLPKLLTNRHKTKRLNSAIDFLSQYQFKKEEFLERIITGNEIWVVHVNLETKQQSMHWRHTTSSSKLKKAVKLYQRRKSWLRCLGMLTASYLLILWNMV